MADEDLEESEGSSGGLLKVILIVIGAILLIAVTVGTTLFFSGFFERKSEADPETVLEEMEEEIEQTEADLAGPGPKTAEIEQVFLISYYVFADPFQVNLKGSRKIMQVKLGVSTYYDKSIMFDEEEGTEGWIPRHKVGIRAEILKILRGVNVSDLEEEDYESRLLEDLRLAINSTLEKYEKTTSAPIEEVYFTEFIVQ